MSHQVFFSKFKGRDGKGILMLRCGTLQTAPRCQTSGEQQEKQQLQLPNEQTQQLTLTCCFPVRPYLPMIFLISSFSLISG